MQRKIIFSLLLVANMARVPAAYAKEPLSTQTQKASKKMAETNEQQAIPQSLWEILKNPEEWEMDIYSFPSNIDTFIPVSTENLYNKGWNVSHKHTSNKETIKEIFTILRKMEFKNYYNSLRETRFLIKLKHKQQNIEIILSDESNAPDFMIFQIEKIENGKIEKFPTGITFQADALKQLTKNVIGE